MLGHEKVRFVENTHPLQDRIHLYVTIVNVKVAFDLDYLFFTLTAKAPFGQEPNDGVVAVSEVTAAWIDERIRVPVVHTLLPASQQVAQILLDRIDLLR